MEYDVKFRVFRGDTGWYYGIRFMEAGLQNPGAPDNGEPELSNTRSCATEQRATFSGLRRLSREISARRKGAPVKVLQ